MGRIWAKSWMDGICLWQEDILRPEFKSKENQVQQLVEAKDKGISVMYKGPIEHLISAYLCLLHI
jgi:hypothetical protein